MSYLYSDITEQIIKMFYKVYNTLGYGFLEKVYENAMFYELNKNGFVCEKQKRLDVFYEDQKVGVYFPDIIVNDKIIIELKANETLAEANEFQLINYLKATDIELGLLLNFGKTPEIKRKIFLNENKKNRIR